MADASPRYAIRTLTIGSDEWAPIRVPIACDYLCVYNGSAAWIRSDKDDAATQKELAAWGQEIILAPIGIMSASPPRFNAGDTVFFMKAQAGESKLAITFIY